MKQEGNGIIYATLGGCVIVIVAIIIGIVRVLGKIFNFLVQIEGR